MYRYSTAVEHNTIYYLKAHGEAIRHYNVAMMKLVHSYAFDRCDSVASRWNIVTVAR